MRSVVNIIVNFS